jgi:putative peptide zinc metalloprotease protein
VRSGGKRRWVVKDPITLAWFELSEEERVILHMLDGQVSLAELCRRFDRRFAPLVLAPSRLQAFLARLHADGLAIADAPGQAGELLERRLRRRWQELRRALRSVLAIRIRGVDPTPLLDWLYPLVRWAFSPAWLAAWAALVAAAAATWVVWFDRIAARLPDFHAFFTPANAIWFLAVVAGAKVLHELGHALACRHFGGHCHEMGVMFLLFAPCLYCDVSDAWMLPERRRRIAISAAGMAVELVLAALATFVWWASAPGLVNAMALRVVLVCSVATLFVNGNPLMRYDGYFILSDVVGVPNLAQQAGEALRGGLARWFLGVPPAPGRRLADASRRWLPIYALASGGYRLAMLAAVVWLMRQALKPHRIEVLADALALALVAGIVIPPALAAAAFVRDPLRRRQVCWPRALLRGGLAAAALAAIVLAPLPALVRAPVVLEPAGARRTYVTVAGTLVRAVREGYTIRAGEPIAVLEDYALRREVVTLEGQRDRQRLEWENLRRRSVADDEAARRAPAAQKALADLDERLRRRRLDLARLTITAPRDGTVLPPPEHTLPAVDSRELSPWRGSPLDPSNVGSYLEVGTLVGLVGDPNRVEARLTIDEADIGRVAPGQQVRLRLAQLPDVTLAGRIVEIARVEAADLNQNPHAAGPAAVPPGGRSVFQARVELDAEGLSLVGGGTGQAHIAAAPRSLVQRGLDLAARTFHFVW